jgi:predicted glycosyltransferase
MKYIIYLGHPAHFHLFKNPIRILKEKNHQVMILIKNKDVLEALVKSTGWQYTNILPQGRKDSKSGIALGLLKREAALFKMCRSFKPDLMMGTSAEIAHIGRLLDIKSVVVNEDDAEAVPFFAKIAYPFADMILAPDCCSTGKWAYKKRGYKGYHELAYLHPSYFQPDETVGSALRLKEKSYFIIRFAQLNAHHDKGRKGINTSVAEKIINILKGKGNIYISSERQLEPAFEKYRIHINPEDMLSAMYYADLYIGDSQTMAAEAAILGTPSIRFNDFVGELSYLEELEHTYGLTYGIKTSEEENLYRKIQELVSMDDLKMKWTEKKKRMFSETVDVTSLIVSIAENFNNR